MRLIDIARQGLRSRSRARRSAVVAFVAGMLVGAPMVALAIHQFPDVPNTNPFHNNIAAIANAGITTGCGGGNYCPDAAVDRAQMAAFMHRGFGRVAANTVNTASAALTTTYREVNSVDLLPGAVGAGSTGFLQADGIVQFRSTDATGCPCILEAFARLDDGTALVGRTSVITAPATAGTWIGTVPITGSIKVSSGSQTVEIVARLMTGSGSWTVAGSELQALYVPFGAAGGTTLGDAPSEPGGDGGPGSVP